MPAKQFLVFACYYNVLYYIIRMTMIAITMSTVLKHIFL
jgi:hypothetical protein